MEVYNFGGKPYTYDEEKKKWIEAKLEKQEVDRGGLLNLFGWSSPEAFKEDPLKAGLMTASMPLRAQAGLLNIITKPLQEGGKWIAEGGKYLGGVGLSQLKGEELWKYGRDYDPLLYGKEEWDEIANDPVKAMTEGGKAGAGFAAYIPIGAGAGWAGRALGSGVSGGFGGLSMSEADLDDPERLGMDVGLGALAAGGTSLGLSGIGGLYSKLRGGVSPKAVSGMDADVLDARWKPGLKKQFDTALMEGNADEAKRLLPDVPEEYATRFSDKLDELGVSVKRQKGVSGLIRGAADEQELSNTAKRFGGKPNKSEGGDGLLRKLVGMDDFNTGGSADDLAKSADDVITRDSGVIAEATEGMSNKGVTMQKAKYLTHLDDKMKTIKDPESRAIIKAVKENIEGMYENAGAVVDDVDPSVHYALKQEIGGKGNWNKLMAEEDVTKGKLYKEIYNLMNDDLDEALKNAKFDQFREVNKNISTAYAARRYTSRISEKIATKSPISAVDILALMGFTVAGSPAAGIGAVLGRRAATSPLAQKGIVAGMRGLADVIGGVGSAGGAVAGGTGQVAGGLAELAGSKAGQYIFPRLATSIGANRMSPVEAAGLSNISEDEVMNEGLRITDEELLELQGGLEGLPQGGLPSSGGGGFPQAGTGGGLGMIRTPGEGNVLHYGSDTGLSYDRAGQDLGMGPGMGGAGGGLGGGMGGGMGAQGGLYGQRMALLNNLMGQGMDPNEAVNIAEFLHPDPEPVGTGKTVPATLLERQAGAKSSLDTLDSLERNLDKFGPAQGIWAKLPLTAPETKAVQSEIDLLAQYIAKSYEGGRVSDADIIRYKAMLPKLTMPEYEVKARLQKVRMMMEIQRANVMKQLEIGGYDPYAGLDMTGMGDTSSQEITGGGLEGMYGRYQPE